MLDAKSVPMVLWECIGIIGFIKDNPEVSCLSNKLKDVQVRVAKHFGVTEKIVSKTLESGIDAVDVYHKLKKK